ncbi:hypothetical protein ACHAWF_013619 [Thalassiosira exigua]
MPAPLPPRRLRSAALRAAAAGLFVEATTSLPSEGRSSPSYHAFFDRVATPLARRLLDPEAAHELALEVVRRGWAPRLTREGREGGDGRGVDMSAEVVGGDEGEEGGRATRRKPTLRLDGPVGLAAGFDKDGIAIAGLFDLGFSSVEVGSVTPRPQPGNPRPRSFRLVEDRGVINRFGFNSEGAERVREHLREYRNEFGGRGSADKSGDDETASASGDRASMGESIGPSILWALGWAWTRLMASPPCRVGKLGINLGKNKNSDDEVNDYAVGIRELGPYADYLVVNVSSPNTPGLRSLQRREPLRRLLSSALEARDAHAPHAPVLVKIAPDLDAEELEDVARVVAETGIDGVVVCNTTSARPEGLASKKRMEAGGLSGAPLRDRSTECIRAMHKLTNGEVPIIGVGGIGSGRDAYDKLRAGASAVQVYSMMVYEGPGLVSRIRKELADILADNGYRSVEDVVGVDQEDIYWRKREERVRRKMQWREGNEKIMVAM